MKSKQLTDSICKLAELEGFELVGISSAKLPDDYINNYRNWLDSGCIGQMRYLEEHFELKQNLSALVSGAMSVISVGCLYRTLDNLPSDQEHGYFSIYARGRDYHKVLKKKLKNFENRIHDFLQEEFGCRAFVDSGPVFEKNHAEESGLGARGLNSLIINQRFGSFFFLGELITDLPLIPTPKSNFEICHCCGKCKKICPMLAIKGDRNLDAEKCIAYLTIEHKGIIPREIAHRMGNHVYGCDDCQMCCPWNKRAVYTKEIDFQCRLTSDFTKISNLLTLSETEFLEFFSGSSIRRIGYESFLRNVLIVAGNSGLKELIPLVKPYLTNTSSDIIRQHALWAIEDLQNS